VLLALGMDFSLQILFNWTKSTQIPTSPFALSTYTAELCQNLPLGILEVEWVGTDSNFER